MVDSEQHHSKYRYRTHPLYIFSGRLTYIYASRIVPASSTKFHDNFTKVMGMVKKYKEDISIIYMNQDLRCVLWCPRCQNTSQVLVCGDDSDVFILPFHHAHRLCDVIMELDVNGREQLEMHKYQWAGKKNRPTSEWNISICCTVVQNRPKVVDICSSPHFYFRYVKFLLSSMHTLAVTIQYYSVRTERTGLSGWWWVKLII